MPSTHRWEHELAVVQELMIAVSRQTDPNTLVKLYGEGVDRLFPTDEFVAVSRREVPAPWYRITRSTRFAEDINPWKQPERLPLMRGGLLGELAFAEEARILMDVTVDPGDPAFEHLAGVRSLLSIPQFDNGVALNTSVMMWNKPNGFDASRTPGVLWQANLFGRATHNMVLREKLAEAYATLDRELQAVADIQRSLLPESLPEIPGVDLAAHYETSQRAGGDYYDLYPLPNGCWGMFIADVSGHGTPAAVVMAVTHAIAHTHPGPAIPPGRVLSRLNECLTARYTRGGAAFITAFYGILDPTARTLRYASAGHNPPRLRRRDGTVEGLNGDGGLPMGILRPQSFPEHEVQLHAGDLLLLFTDGITEAMNRTRELFGLERLDAQLADKPDSSAALIERVLNALREFAHHEPVGDDRTMLVARLLE